MSSHKYVTAFCLLDCYSAPTGSHRVLLKLRKMRPTSVHEASQDLEGLGSSSGGEIADTCSVKSYRCNSQMSSSRSDNFAGYNQTWNERSLRKHSTSNNRYLLEIWPTCLVKLKGCLFDPFSSRWG